nr:Putative kinesin-like protein, identical [Ipomoea batatas]
MRKRSKTTRKFLAEDYLKTPPIAPVASPNLSVSKSPMPFQFKFSAFDATSLTPPASSKKRRAGVSSKPMRLSKSPASIKSYNTIADLRSFASSGLDSIKRQLDCSHSEILKDIEASHSRFYKRLKIQTQACEKMADEAEREHKKMSERINEGREAMKASYTEFLAEVQTNASRFCKTSIPELLQSAEKAIDSLRSRYGVPSNLTGNMQI